MASSSSSPQPRSIISAKLYDVFISHRGPDVKLTFAKQLYDLLQARRCNPFIDREEIEGGDCITFAIHNAICSSRVQIAIFSKGFAESSWCLDEVVLMLRQTDAVFIPVFYGVEPWELRYIDQHTDALSQQKSAKESQYTKAFADYQSKGRNLDKLEEWKRALATAANISGYELAKHRGDLVETTVSRVLQVLQEKEKSTPLHVAKYPVGLVELVQDFESCCPQTAGMVGIFGLEGSGKTTLAKKLFNKKSSCYHRSSFLSDVRESKARGGLHRLQSQLLKDLLSIDDEIRSVHHGMGKLEDYLGRARHLRYLIVMDDIDHLDQLNALLPEGTPGCGSLVIITTRDQSLLRGVDALYKMKGMGRNRAKELFCSHAFRRPDPLTSIDVCYEELVESFVEFCGGLPLSLIVLGAHVYGRNEYYWKLELEKVKKIPPADIMERLKISFDGLDREEKQIFIDIACFFNNIFLHGLKNKAIAIWKASGWSSGEHALQRLEEKCLIKTGLFGGFEMHDHLRDLGREMADEFEPPRLWQPELLKTMEAHGFTQALVETKGRCFHSFFDWSQGREFTYLIADTNLVFLQIDPDFAEYVQIHPDFGEYVQIEPVFQKYKLYNIPSWIPLRKLHYLSIYRVKDWWSSFEEQLESNGQATFELRGLEINNSPPFQNLPNLIKMFSHLEELTLWRSLDMTNATSLVQSLKQLSNLRSLFLKKSGIRGNLDLSKGRDCSTSSRMDSLETIELMRLPRIFKLMISEEMCPKLQKLEIRKMKSLKEIELKQTEKVNTASVHDCPKSETITITGLQVFNVNKFAGLKAVDRSRLEHIWISACPELQSVKGLEELPGLKSLIIEVPENRNAWAGNYIRGLRRLFVKKTILFQKTTERSSKLHPSLLSEVIDSEAISKIEFEIRTLKMKSSLNAITIYALLVTPMSGCTIEITLGYGDMSFFTPISYGSDDRVDDPLIIIIIVLTELDSEVSLENLRKIQGFKVTVKFREEDKALIVLSKIVDQLCMERTNKKGTNDN